MIHMLHTYRTMASFYDKIKSFRWTVLLILIWWVLLDGLHCNSKMGQKSPKCICYSHKFRKEYVSFLKNFFIRKFHRKKINETDIPFTLFF